jgi:hypothetical protein
MEIHIFKPVRPHPKTIGQAGGMGTADIRQKAYPLILL